MLTQEEVLEKLKTPGAQLSLVCGCTTGADFALLYSDGLDPESVAVETVEDLRAKKLIRVFNLEFLGNHEHEQQFVLV